MTPEECANRVLNDYDITGVPAFSFKKIFKACNINCDEYNYNDPKYSGSLHKVDGDYFILVNTDSGNRGRINFTKSHELGHFFLKHKGDKFECSAKDMYTNDIAHKPQEVEANRFAGAFLLPSNKIKLYLSDDNYDFTTLGGIASNFQVSLSATVIRTIPMLSGKWYAAWSEKGIIQWTVKSPACRLITLSQYDMVKEKSVAYRCFNESYKPLTDTYETVPVLAWANNSAKTKVKEMTIFMKNYNATLSLVRF